MQADTTKLVLVLDLDRKGAKSLKFFTFSADVLHNFY